MKGFAHRNFAAFRSLFIILCTKSLGKLQSGCEHRKYFIFTPRMPFLLQSAQVTLQLKITAIHDQFKGCYVRRNGYFLLNLFYVLGKCCFFQPFRSLFSFSLSLCLLPSIPSSVLMPPSVAQ